jgi:hypothetical protein
MSGGWSIPLDELAAKQMLDLTTVARKSTLDLFRAVGYRSPVGNPELWAENAAAAAHNQEIATHNAALRQDPGNLTKNGRLKRGLKRKDIMAIKAPPGYVGGRFRANWNVSYGAPDFSTTESTQKERVFEEARKAMTLPVGGLVYLSNGLPYGPRLEYEGWSKQAPSGMIRVSALEFQDYVKKALNQ